MSACNESYFVEHKWDSDDTGYVSRQRRILVGLRHVGQNVAIPNVACVQRYATFDSLTMWHTRDFWHKPTR